MRHNELLNGKTTFEQSSFVFDVIIKHTLQSSSSYTTLHIVVVATVYCSPRTARLVNMAPLLADGQLLQNGELEEYLEKNLNVAKVHLFL